MAQTQTSTRTLSLPQAFAMAQQKHVAGDLDIAKDIYERIARQAPDHADSLVMLASIAYRQGRDAEARAQLDRSVDLIRAIVQRNPEDMRSRAVLVNLLLAQGRAGEAEAMIEGLILPLNPMRADPVEFNARREDGIARGLPPMIISTLPKSASESIWNKLAQGLGLAQCYLSLGLFPDCALVPSRVAEAAKGGITVKEHIGPSAHNIATLSRNRIDRLVVHHRDPRQATLSWAHFVRDDVGQRLMAPLWRKIVPPAGVQAGDFPGLLDWCIENYLPRLVGFLSGWRAVANDPAQPVSVQFMSFESFLADPQAYFGRTLDFFDVPEELFSAEAEAGAQTVHLRKGESDEWRGVFSPAQRERAWALIPADMAEELGWSP